MATFKVGQRVRVRQEVRALCVTNHSMHAGKEGVITRLNTEFDLRFGAFHELDIRHIDGFPIRVAEDYLEPLTDPGADAFIERIKKLKPYDEPKADVQRRFIEKIESVVGPLGPRFK